MHLAVTVFKRAVMLNWKSESNMTDDLTTVLICFNTKYSGGHPKTIHQDKVLRIKLSRIKSWPPKSLDLNQKITK